MDMNELHCKYIKSAWTMGKASNHANKYNNEQFYPRSFQTPAIYRTNDTVVWYIHTSQTATYANQYILRNNMTCIMSCT